jgi:hypothetical protein
MLFDDGVRDGIEKVAMGVDGKWTSGHLFWKKKHYYYGDNDKGVVDATAARLKKENPKAKFKQIHEPGGSSRGRDWSSVTMSKKAAGAAAPIGGTGENPTSGGDIEPGGDEIRHTRHPSRAERRLTMPKKKAFRKVAENPSQGMDSSDIGTKAQSSGEANMHSSAPGVTGRAHSGRLTKGKRESSGRPGGGGSGKGQLPIWIRYNKNLSSQKTWDGGDRNDDQFHVPAKGGSA